MHAGHEEHHVDAHRDAAEPGNLPPVSRLRAEGFLSNEAVEHEQRPHREEAHQGESRRGNLSVDDLNRDKIEPPTEGRDHEGKVE